MIDGSSGLAWLDDDLAGWGVGRRRLGVRRRAAVVTHLGGTWVGAAAVGRRRHRRPRPPPQPRGVRLPRATVLLGEKLIVNGLKEIVDRGPPRRDAAGRLLGRVVPLGPRRGGCRRCGRPSRCPRPRSPRASSGPLLAGGAALIAVAVAASRALLGVHWLTDVVAGLAIGYGWFLVVAVIFGGRRNGSATRSRRSRRGFAPADVTDRRRWAGAHSVSDIGRTANCRSLGRALASAVELEPMLAVEPDIDARCPGSSWACGGGRPGGRAPR